MRKNIEEPIYSLIARSIYRRTLRSLHTHYSNILITVLSVPRCDADDFDELFNDVLTGFEDDDLG
jgi:hypothetical protein